MQLLPRLTAKRCWKLRCAGIGISIAFCWLLVTISATARAVQIVSVEVAPKSSSATAINDSSAQSEHLPATLPLRRDPPATESVTNTRVLSFIGMLSLCAIAAIWGQRVWRRTGKNADVHVPWTSRLGYRKDKDLKLLGNVRLTPRHSVHTLQWHGQIFLLGCSEQSITLLSQTAMPDTSSQPSGNTSGSDGENE